MMTVFSTGCCNCKRLIEKLDSYNISYSVSQDVEYIKRLGFKTVPILQVGNKFYTYKEAVGFLKGEGNVQREI